MIQGVSRILGTIVTFPHLIGFPVWGFLYKKYTWQSLMLIIYVDEFAPFFAKPRPTSKPFIPFVNLFSNSLV